jgi:hypothetical protein
LRSSILMRRENLQTFLDSSPTARLLRSDLAPYVLDFFQQTFKSGERLVWGQTELKSHLTLYQQTLSATPARGLQGSPDRYLTQWVDAAWLKRYLVAHSAEPQYELTRHAEEALRFVDAALSRHSQLVGTESRLRLVIETLKDIVRGASADPQQRLAYLRAQRASIDAEIAAIEQGQSVQTYQPVQVRERFQTAVELLKTLQADFRAVEERFQSIAREVQLRQSQGCASRGEILGAALAAEEELKSKDEALSFYAFVAFLFSPTEQAALIECINQLQQLDALADQADALSHLRRMVPALLAEADKVMRTTARLTATLHRLLNAQSVAHRARLATVLHDIREAALRLGESSIRPDIECPLAVDLDLGSPWARTFWTPAATFEHAIEAAAPVQSTEALAMATTFARMRRLDLPRLRNTIREITRDGDSHTLREVSERFPISGGVVELLGYLQIAHDDGHIIDPNQTETILIPALHDTDSIQLSVPRTVFIPPKTISKTKTGRKPK